MSTEEWQSANNRYLAASLEWLRLRLQRLAPEEPLIAVTEPAKPVEPSEVIHRGRLSRWFSRDDEVPDNLPLLPEATPASPRLDERIGRAFEEREAAAQLDPPPALVTLAQRFGLSQFERDALLLCAAVEFDPSFTSLYARAQGSTARTYPTFALALSALEKAEWEAVSAHRPLRYAHLIEVNQPGATPLTSSPLRADERVVDYLKGQNSLDERLSTLLALVDESEAQVSESQQAVADDILRRLGDAVTESVVPVVQTAGTDPGSKLAVARQVCSALERQLFQIPVEALPSQMAEIETLARLWARENFLTPVALYLSAEGLDSAQDSTALQRFLSRQVGLVFVGIREAPVRFGGPTFTVEAGKPTPGEQYDAWVGVLTGQQAGEETGRAAEMLSGQFDLNLRDVQAAAESAASDEHGSVTERLWTACRDLVRPRLDTLAQRLDVKATWDDLVLPDEQLGLMRRIAAQVRERHRVYDEWGFASKMNRGFGISALFTGESGTGKSMAAEVIANDLQLNLYRIDLSAVVSKYIGETEKNLRKLFDAAEQGGAILFFDEADALFGKRSEVKDSHDRYANIEINYLLQRMEAFRGLAILATNLKTALDPAFMRRLRFIVNFQFPGIKERKQIWQKALPAQTPKDRLDYDRLARMNMTGGNIHSIALNAAFLAAEKGQAVTMPLVLAAARTEMRKLEKPFSEAEFKV